VVVCGGPWAADLTGAIAAVVGCGGWGIIGDMAPLGGFLSSCDMGLVKNHGAMLAEDVAVLLGFPDVLPLMYKRPRRKDCAPSQLIKERRKLCCC
jgi:hypothetical protein